jgi:hypothetical protein
MIILIYFNVFFAVLDFLSDQRHFLPTLLWLEIMALVSLLFIYYYLCGYNYETCYCFYSVFGL